MHKSHKRETVVEVLQLQSTLFPLLTLTHIKKTLVPKQVWGSQSSDIRILGAKQVWESRSKTCGAKDEDLRAKNVEPRMERGLQV